MKVKLHPHIQGLSGTFDDWVYRQVGDQVFVSPKPDPREHPASETQIGTRTRFREAVAYAKKVLADPCQNEVYAELARLRGRRADKLLTSDYLTPPEIRRIDLSSFHGKAGNRIRVIAFDDIEVVGVSVRIESAGTLL